MKPSELWKKAESVLCAIPPADQCLIGMMGLLMAQSAHNLFFHELVLSEGSAIDVVIRTTAAAIFGYFISANFLSQAREGTESAPRDIDDAPEERGRGRKEADRLSPARNRAEQRSRLQIFVVAAVGMLALLLLIFARDVVGDRSAPTATLSQLRDFVSGSVGFLLGQSTHAQKSP